MMQLPKLISKTKILQGYQCHKNIYLSVHRKDLIPPVTPELQSLFDQGNAVTEEARKRFADGVLVDFPAYDFVGSLKKTRELLSDHTHVIFEAAFEYKGCYARADIVSYNPATQRWTVREVKSTTKVKDEHLDDVGLQVWIMANAGLPIEKIILMHLNPLCRYPNLENLFVEEDVTERLRERHLSIAPRLNGIFSSLRQDSVPEVDIGPHCTQPRECQFWAHCSSVKKLPEPGLFSIPGLREKKWDLYARGLTGLADIPDEELNEAQQRCLEVLRTGQRFVDSSKIQAELSGWKFPLVFLDFETINPAIPRYVGAQPFMQVPFQFSVHILDSWESEPRHIEFLAASRSDPRPELVPALIEACRGSGSVVAYYAKFEEGRLRDLEDYMPEAAAALAQIRERLVDPLPLIREAVYDAGFADSYSIKSVGPALLGDLFSYEQMDVGDGGAAQRAFEEMTDPHTPGHRQGQLKNALLQYCEKDTRVMVELVKWLHQC